MRKLIATALVVAGLGYGLASAPSAQATPQHRFAYTATVRCYEPLTRHDARHIALVQYRWSVWGTLTLRYVCNTAVARGARTYRYTATVVSRAPMAEDSAAHVRLTHYARHDGSVWDLRYHTRRFGY